MAVGVYFSAFITPQQYDSVIDRIKDQPAPKGRQYHVAFSEGGDKLAIFDVWDSQADFEAFFSGMAPMMQEFGIEEAKPNIVPVHNIMA
jgi:hypothetical protein